MKKIIVLILAMLVSYSVFAADFSLGFCAGFNYTNPDRIDNLNDRKFSGSGDFSSAVVTGWKVNDWFSLRSGIDLFIKAYKEDQLFLGSAFHYRDFYLDVPMLADFSFGTEKVKGHTYLGLYFGLWLGQDIKEKSGSSDGIYRKNKFDSEKDSRFNAGIAGGLGLSISVSEKISLMTDAMMYYDITSYVKQYQPVGDNKYNNSIAVRLGMMYSFGNV